MLLIDKLYKNKLVCSILRALFRDQNFEIILNRLQIKENYELNPKLLDKVHGTYFYSLSDGDLTLEIVKELKDGNKVWICTNEIPFWYRYFIKKSALKLKHELFVLHEDR